MRLIKLLILPAALLLTIRVAMYFLPDYHQVGQILTVLTAVWGLFNLGGLFDGTLRRYAQDSSALDHRFIPMIRRGLRFALFTVAGLYIAHQLGFNITSWLAGAGIAGLAISLAAQDTLKNLFGSFTIFLDRPFRIGDRVICGKHTGNVVDIGCRSTKIQTSQGHLVSVPNSQVANTTIENIGGRKFIRRTINISVTYGTDIPTATRLLKEILTEEGLRENINPEVDSVTLHPRVYFNDFNPDNLNIYVTYWFAPPHWWDYMTHAERVNLRILSVFREAGIDFAFPTQTIQLETV